MFGFADSSARKREAVERVAPFVALSYSLLVAWAAILASSDIAAQVPVRPWYTHKRGLSFADILRAARRELAGVEVLDPRRASEDLPVMRRRAPPPSIPAQRRVA